MLLIDMPYHLLTIIKGGFNSNCYDLIFHIGGDIVVKVKGPESMCHKT